MAMESYQEFQTKHQIAKPEIIIDKYQDHEITPQQLQKLVMWFKKILL